MSDANADNSIRPIDSDEDETLEKQRESKILFQSTLDIIVQKSRASESGLMYSNNVLHCVNELLFSIAERFSLDLVTFAAHSKRTTVTPDDVYLSVRRNPSLVDALKQSHSKIHGPNLKKQKHAGSK